MVLSVLRALADPSLLEAAPRPMMERSTPQGRKIAARPSGTTNATPGDDDDDWPSGRKQLRVARARGRWSDGRPVGRGFPQPCLHSKYARLIAAQIKTAEGRAGGGWLQQLPLPRPAHELAIRVLLRDDGAVALTDVVGVVGDAMQRGRLPRLRAPLPGPR